MCSAPVHVKLQVSLQHKTYKGESSGFVPSGQIMLINISSSFSPETSPEQGKQNYSINSLKTQTLRMLEVEAKQPTFQEFCL